MFTFFFLITTVIFPLNYELCFCGCSRAEYKIINQCCPMCAPGNVVQWHCTDDTSTTCVPCPEFTFTDESNGLEKCFPCTVCDARQGLRVNKACTRSSNSICGPLEGFYCIDKNKGSCTLAVEHSKCSPGKHIKRAGTPSTDTVCGDCIDGTYSNGSFSSCLAHIKCESVGLIEIHPGTHSSDAECGNSSAPSAIIASAIGVVILLVMITFLYIWRKKHQKSTSLAIQETIMDLPEQPSIKGIESVEPYSLSLKDEVGLKNPNLEIATGSSLLTHDSTHSEETVQPEHRWLKEQTDLVTKKVKLI